MQQQHAWAWSARLWGSLAAGAAGTVAIGAFAVPALITQTHAHAAPPTRSAVAAPAPAGANKGGNVIVVLKNQHSNLNLVHQSKLRVAVSHHDQAPIVSSIKAHGGSQISSLISVNAVAAKLSAGEVTRLRRLPSVKQIVPDSPVLLNTGPSTPLKASAASVAQDATGAQCPPSSVIHPGEAQEPEAIADIHASTGDPSSPDEANSIATGKGVNVAISGMNLLTGNPNFQRADGTHVVIGYPAADETADSTNDEAYLDGSSVAAQGGAAYTYAGALPHSSIDPSCKFYLQGDAPGASLVDTTETTTPTNGLERQQLLTQDANDTTQTTESESQVIKGIDKVAAVGTIKADVISESFGNSNFVPQIVYTANDAAVAAGIPVVVSSGDSGISGTINPMSADPNVIATGAVDNNRLIAIADNFSSYQSNQIAALSSGGVSTTDRLLDLVGPGWYGEAACAPNKGGCPNYPTESGRGTSESAPLTAGAIADIIQAYRDTHGGNTPTPQQDKEILTSTASDLDAPSAEQGGGLLDIYAAVKAAQQLPGTTDPEGPGDSPGLVASPSQLDVVGTAGSTSHQTVSVYNTSPTPTTIHGSYRTLSDPAQIGGTVTQSITAPDPALPVPPQGATAASDVTFDVPAGLDRLSADLIWPDATNNNNLYIQIFNPDGVFVQESYDYGSAGRNGGRGSVSNSQFVDIADPAPGKWTAKILWGGKDNDLAAAPITPGAYRGTASFAVWGQHWITTPATDAITIPGHTSAQVPLDVALPGEAGDYPESVQFTADDGAKLSYALTRRSLIPNGFNIPFDTTITSSVGRTIGQINQYNIDVPAGSANLSVHFTTPDASADNAFTYYLVNPSGAVATSATTPTTVNGVATAEKTLTVANPAPGRWQIDVKIGVTTSGLEFTQTVNGFATVTPTTGVSGTVPATLALSLSGPATFGAFTPAVAKTYTASLAATVTSTAGDATLSASDADATAPGHLVNGAFTLPSALKASATSTAAGTSGGGVFADLSSPAALLTYSGPVSNDPVTVSFQQAIGANDALRTGSYGKTITFTLSTTTP